MSAIDTAHELDNPFWASLSTRQAHFALGGNLARRYLASISPIVALTGAEPANVAELETLIDVGEDVGIVGPFAPALPPNWTTLYESRVTQMIRMGREPLPEGDADASILGPGDVAEMLALVELTKPGPFRQRTIELGTYLGIREAGRLVAMAGERSWVGDFREVSAVCTHPEAQKRGHARALIGRVVNRMLRVGQTPYIHVESLNARAIELYTKLGFSRRIEFGLVHARRMG